VDRLVISNAGNVGIGTTQPLQALHVQGTAQATTFSGSGASLTALPSASITGLTTSKVLVGSATSTILQPTNLHWDNANNRLGINATSPGQALHVVGDTRIEGNLTVNGTQTIVNTVAGTTEQLIITNDGTGPALKVTQTGSSPIADFYDDGEVLALRVADGGNVGIGTSLPQAKLHVMGTMRSTIGVELGGAPNQGGSGGYRLLRLTPITGTSTQITFDRSIGTGTAQSYIYNDASVMEINAPKVAFVGGDLDVAGNVGIGTTVPLQKLHVQGNVQASTQFLGQAADSVNAPSFSWTGDTNTGMYRPGADKLGLVTAGFERVSVLANGNVGIDKTNPGYKFDVSGDIFTTGMLCTSRQRLCFASPIDTNHTIYNNYNNIDGEGAFDGMKMNVYAGLDIRTGNSIGVAPTLRMRINSDGNVGIGVATPSQRVEVAGNIYINSTAGQLYVGNNNASTVVGSVGGTIFLGGTSGDPAHDHTVIESRLYAAPESSELLIFKGNDVLGPDRIRLRGAQIVFDTYTTATTDRVSESIKMIITENGNVGIGTTNPLQKLHISAGNSSGTLYGPNTTYGANLYVGSGTPSKVSTTTAQCLTTNGNLHLDSATNFTTYLNFYANGDGTTSTSTIASYGKWTHLTGDVGIGTTNPLTKLDVSGKIHSLGSIMSVYQYVLTTNPSTTSAFPTFVDTGITVTLTPTLASSKFMIQAKVIASIYATGAATGTSASFRFMRNSTPIGLGSGGDASFRISSTESAASSWTYSGGADFLDSPNTTSAITYKIQYCTYSSSTTVRLNATSFINASTDGSTGISSLTIYEIGA